MPEPPASPQAIAGIVAPASTDEIRIDDVAADAMGVGELDAGDAEPDEVAVGDVTLSAVLFGILVEEALQHLTTLTNELEVLQFDTRQRPSASMVRASHTLCGIHRTGGFPLIAATAKALEQTLLALQQREPPLPGAAMPVLARAVEGLRAFVGRVRDRAGFSAADSREAEDIRRELEGLRQETDQEPVVADAESQAEDEAARDEHDEARARGPVVVPPLAPEHPIPPAPTPAGTSAPPAVDVHAAHRRRDRSTSSPRPRQ